MNIKRYGINNSDDIRNTFNSLLVSKSWSLDVMFRGGEKNKQMKHQTNTKVVCDSPSFLRDLTSVTLEGRGGPAEATERLSDRGDTLCSLRPRLALRSLRLPVPALAPTPGPANSSSSVSSSRSDMVSLSPARAAGIWTLRLRRMVCHREGDRSVSETLNAETHPIPAFFTNYYRTWDIKIIKAILTQAKTSQLSLFPVYKRKFPHFHQIQSKFVPGSDTFSPIHHFVPSLNLKAIIFLPPTEDYNPISNLRVGKPQENAPLTAFLLNPSSAGDSKSKWPLTV